MIQLRLSQQHKGFTVVELLVAIAVIGILATIIILSYGGYQQRTRDNVRKSDVQTLASAVKAYATWNNTYVESASCGNNGDGFIGATSADAGAALGPYAATSVIGCLQAAGSLKSGDGIDPSACRYNSGGACGSGNPTKAYMKATCTVSGVKTVYIMAYLEGGSTNSVATMDGLCGKGWGTAYGMNYYATVR
jgi:prepilin-type N-terminal cleavage/methylation domain-containing protein